MYFIKKTFKLSFKDVTFIVYRRNLSDCPSPYFVKNNVLCNGGFKILCIIQKLLYNVCILFLCVNY